MPTGKALLTEQQVLIVEKLDALRQEVQLGIADIDAGRFCEFRTKDEVRRHCTGLIMKVLSSNQKIAGQKYV